MCMPFRLTPTIGGGIGASIIHGDTLPIGVILQTIGAIRMDGMAVDTTGVDIILHTSIIPIGIISRLIMHMVV